MDSSLCQLTNGGAEEQEGGSLLHQLPEVGAGELRGDSFIAHRWWAGELGESSFLCQPTNGGWGTRWGLTNGGAGEQGEGSLMHHLNEGDLGNG